MRRRHRPGAMEGLTGMIAELSRRMERANIAEYVEFLRSPRRVLWANLLAGLARGFGFAIGASVLAALFLYLLSVIISLNIPVIGRIVAEIVKFVESYGRE